MIRIPGVPFLPGTTFRDTSRTDFRRTQQFISLNGIKMLSDRETQIDISKRCPNYQHISLYPPTQTPKVPSWLVYDKQILCFFGYFKETLNESDLAPYQVRKVKILYHLEDGTIEISEPPTENSGIPQGCIVSRQRVPRSMTPSLSSERCKHEFITALDFNVNQTIRIFDRVYYITGCDIFTRNFLNRAGIPVSDPVNMPEDPSTELRKKSQMKVKSSLPKHNDFEKFLKYDKKILKFNGYWDDKSEYGEEHNLEIYYYLSDDSVEIKEILDKNSRDGCGLYIKRGKLPREWQGTALPGQLALNEPILNVLGNSFLSSRYIKDCIELGKHVKFYKESDLLIGQHLNVYGRDVVITDCDEPTREFYRMKYGIEDFQPLPNPAIIKSKLREEQHIKLQQHTEREIPPWNGWGTHEDSEQNCLYTEPKPPLPDMNKFLKLDRFILRFGAKMLSQIKENLDRSFIISYYLSEDTIQIYEISDRNSGFHTGEFLKRSKVMLPHQDLYTSDKPKYYKPHHLYIGATLNIHDFLFHIVSADEYTLLYMENHPHQFPYSNIEEIMTKIRNALKPDYKNFIAKHLNNVEKQNEHCSVIKFENLRKFLIELLCDCITDHEIITVCRYFSALKPHSTSSQSQSSTVGVISENYNREKIRSAAHWEVRRNLWDDYDRLKEYIYHLDDKCTGFINEIKLRTIILGCRLPFNQDLINAIMKILNRNCKSEIEICDFINFIDIKKPIMPIQPINIAFELCPNVPFLQSGLLVNWNHFLQKIDLEKDIES